MNEENQYLQLHYLFRFSLYLSSITGTSSYSFKTSALFEDYQHLYLGQEVYLTSVCLDEIVNLQENCIRDLKRPVTFSCVYFGLTSKSLQKLYLSFIWKVLGDVTLTKLKANTS